MRVFTLVALLSAACTTVHPSTEDTAGLVGTPESQAAFAGLWRGTLDAVDDTLDGPIEFRLEKGSAFFMTEARTPRRIQWVRVSHDKLAGATDTFVDPARNVEVYMT